MPTAAEESIDAFQHYYSRPPERPKSRSWKQIIYDPEEKTYCGRTVDSWGEYIPDSIDSGVSGACIR